MSGPNSGAAARTVVLVRKDEPDPVSGPSIRVNPAKENRTRRKIVRTMLAQVRNDNSDFLIFFY